MTEQTDLDNQELLRLTCQGLVEVVEALHAPTPECELGCDACSRLSHARGVLAAL